MQNKALRIILFIIQTAVFAVCIVFCIKGLLLSNENMDIVTFTWTLVKVLSFFLLSIGFFKTSFSRSTPGDVFLLLYIFSGSVSFISVFNLYEKLTGICLIAPDISVRIYLLSTLIMSLSALGSGLFHQNNEHAAVSRFAAIIIFLALIVCNILPAGQTYDSLLSKPVVGLLYAINGVSAIIYVLLSATDPPGPDLVRHLSMLLMVIGNHLSFCFDGYYIQIVGNTLFISGCLMLMILTMRTYSRL